MSGSARGMVTETGMRTAIGRIGQLLEEAPDAETPLERKLDALGHQLIGLTLAVAALVTGVGALRGVEWSVMLKTGIALAVAAVPEGLPAIATIALAIGVRRMARRNALVRRLPSVDTLGSVTVVCTDKTGTLTEGRMSAARVWLPPGGDERLLLETAAMANRVAAMGHVGSDMARFDPTEVALVELAAESGLDAPHLHADHPAIAQVPFTAAGRYMASLHDMGDGARWYAKGAPEAILERCSTKRDGEEDVPLSRASRDEILGANETLAAEGLRVLGFAVSPASTAPSDGSQPDALSFLGLVGLIDPPASGVMETVHLFGEAGIRVLMLTGDHRLTAEAVGAAVGIGTEAPAIDMTGWRPEDPAAIREAVAKSSVFARVSPEQKLDIVNALQESGEIVAMLGDGVNDAAALKRADVGVAMGRRGAEVARQASEIILQDDRFETVGAAVAEGRVVFANIRKFAYYLFSCNLAEVLVLLIAGVLGWPMPLLPLQILWLNLVTDTFPALALAFEPGEEDLMRRPPRPPTTPILGRTELRGIFIYATAITAVTLIACYIGLRTDPAGGTRAMTLTFATLALAQVFHLGNARSHGPVLARARATANGYAIAGAAISIVLLVAATSFPPLSRILSISQLAPLDWCLVVGLGAIPAILGQVSKLIRQRSAFG